MVGSSKSRTFLCENNTGAPSRFWAAMKENNSGFRAEELSKFAGKVTVQKSLVNSLDIISSRMPAKDAPSVTPFSRFRSPSITVSGDPVYRPVRLDAKNHRP